MNYLKDPVFQAVRHLRNPRSIASILQPAWHPSDGESWPPDSELLYVNYKPFERARLVLRVHPGRRVTGKVREAFELFFETRAPRPGSTSGGHGSSADLDRSYMRIPEWNTIAWTLTNAPGLGELAVLRDPYSLAELVGGELGLVAGSFAVELVRYVPRKRAVLKIVREGNPDAIYAKLLRDRDAMHVAGRFLYIDRNAAALDFRVPEVLCCSRPMSTVFMTGLQGHPFTASIRRAETESYRAVGAALASLHRSSLTPDGFWTTEDQLHDLRRHLAGMARAVPLLRLRIDKLVSLLESSGHDLPPANLRPIHGNLFGDQILWDGDTVGIVDWDRLAQGDPLYDLGRLLAHHVFEANLAGVDGKVARKCAGALLDAYCGFIGHPVDYQRLAWHTAVELLLRAKIAALRPLPTGWPDHCAHAVLQCERIVEGKCKSLALPSPLQAERIAM